MISGLQHFICQRCKIGGKNMICLSKNNGFMLVPPFSSKVSVTDFKRPQTLVSAILFREHNSLMITVCRRQWTGWSLEGTGWERTTLVFFSLPKQWGGSRGIWNYSRHLSRHPLLLLHRNQLCLLSGTSKQLRNSPA